MGIALSKGARYMDNNQFVEGMCRAFPKLIEWTLIFILTFLLGMCVVQKSSATQPLSKQEIISLIRVTALEYGINPNLAVAIAQVESRIEPNAVGMHGEIGVFQLLPKYHAVQAGDVYSNVRVAMKYLAKLKRKCGDYGSAFYVCYNYGPTRKLTHPTRFPYYKLVQLELMKTRSGRGHVEIALAE